MAFKSRQYTLGFGCMYYVLGVAFTAGGIAISVWTESAAGVLLLVAGLLQLTFGLVKYSFSNVPHSFKPFDHIYIHTYIRYIYTIITRYTYTKSHIEPQKSQL